MTSSVPEDGRNEISQSLLSGYSSLKDKYPILGRLQLSESDSPKPPKPKRKTDKLTTFGDALSLPFENMQRLKKLNLKRAQTVTKMDRPPLASTNVEGRVSALFPKMSLKSSPKRRSVSLDRRTTSRKGFSNVKNANETKENDFTCPICLDILYRPRELSCGHLFCLICLQSYFNTCSKYFSCPSCRQVISLPENGVSGLERNPTLELVANQLNEKKRQMVQKAKLCFKCHSDFEVKECGHCEKGWCVVCQPQHLKEIKNDLMHLKDKLLESRERLFCKQEEEETRYDKLEEKITEALELRKGELLLQVKDLRKISQSRIKKISSELENSLQNIFQDEQGKSSLELQWKKYHEMNKMLSKDATSDKRITLDTTSLTLTQSPSSEGAVHPPVTSKDSTTEDDVDDIDDEGISLPKDLGALYRKKSSYSKCRWSHSSCKRPAGVAVSPWTGFFYVTASDSCKVHIFNPHGKEISSFGSRGQKEGCFLCPIGITFSLFNNELYITDKWKHCIHVFDCEGRFLREIGKKGKGLGEFSSPEGIATDRGGNIYVADTCNDRVQILDKDGVYLREVGLVSSEFLGHGRLYTKREFNEPVGVAASPDGGKIYVADSGNHRIRIFDGQTGERLLVFGSRGHNRGQFESPESVAVDDEGFIVVGDSGNGRIQVFRPNGRFVRVLGSRGGAKGEFGWVSGIALTKSGGIVVTDFKNNAIAVF